MWMVRNRSRFSFLNPVAWYRSVQAFREKQAEKKQDRRIVARVIPVQDIDGVLEGAASKYEQMSVVAERQFQETGRASQGGMYGDSSARYFRARNVRDKVRADLSEMSQTGDITFGDLCEKLRRMQESLPVPSDDRHGRAGYCFDDNVYSGVYLKLTTKAGPGFRWMFMPIRLADVKIADIQYAGRR